MKKLRRAFTLIELLAVIGIIGLLAAILAGLRPSSPIGLDGAASQAQSIFALARSQAMLANNPDPDFPDWKLYTPRARVIILNDPDDEQNHLRRIGVILGGQLADPKNPASIKSEKDLQEGDLKWYAIGEGSILPDGVFYVDNGNSSVTKQILRSTMQNKTFATPTMRVEFPRRKAQQSGSGKNWFYYEFLASGAANMTDADGSNTGARFIVTEGYLHPGTKKIIPVEGKENNVGGFLVLRSGNTVLIKNYEAK
jgi:prepilin-type N-terminal cleavage/methylation domain-containing protein